MIFLIFKSNDKLFPGDALTSTVQFVNMLLSVRSANPIF